MKKTSTAFPEYPVSDTANRQDSPSRITSTIRRPFSTARRFAGILATPLGTEIPQRVRNSHHWIVAGTGAGKTTALQYLIAKDLERAVRGECSVVVIDSQHQLIEQLSSLKLFAPGQPLDGKLCLLDAADVEYPDRRQSVRYEARSLGVIVGARKRASHQQRA